MTREILGTNSDGEPTAEFRRTATSAPFEYALGPNGPRVPTRRNICRSTSIKPYVA